MPTIRKAVIDTGPLFSALVLNYAETLKPDRASALVQKNDRIPLYLRSRTQQQSMIALFHNVRLVLTSSHVIAELQGLQQGLHSKDFWLFAMNWLSRKGVDERFIRLLDLKEDERWREAVCLIGPTDTGLINIALRDGAVLLTDDRKTLFPIASSQNVNCKLVEHLL